MQARRLDCLFDVTLDRLDHSQRRKRISVRGDRSRFYQEASSWNRTDRASRLVERHATLKPAGIYVKSRIDPAVWFLADKTDVRSSFALEDAATEFDIQGLELDWVGICWDANLRREGNQWKPYYFRGTRWERITDDTRAAYLANSYRVLLTRARQGMAIYVPAGSDIDDTRIPDFYEQTYAFLCECGITKIA